MPLSDPSWVWPFWLERQMDPANPEFVPGTDDAELVNLTHRSFTTIGSLATPERATVDPRGLITASAGGWSVDWWIGAEDQWHRPSRAPVVRQRLLGDAPVLETAMRVPGGGALHRVRVHQHRARSVHRHRDREPHGGAGRSGARRAALQRRGLRRRAQIDLVDTTVLVDGEPGLVFTKPPADLVGSVLASGTARAASSSAAARPRGPVLSTTPTAGPPAFVFPLTTPPPSAPSCPCPIWPGAPGVGDAGARRARCPSRQPSPPPSRWPPAGSRTPAGVCSPRSPTTG
jgi:hypothetical protein